MGSLLRYRNAVINTLREDSRLQAPKIWVGKHPGKWDYKELKRYAERTPALLVTPMGGHVSKTPYVCFEVHMAAVLMHEDKGGVDREDQTLDATDLVLRIISDTLSPTSLWGLTNAIQKPFDIAARNMFSVEADKEGIALWCIVWKQRFDLENPETADTPIPMRAYQANWFEPGLKGADYDGTEESTGVGAEPYAQDVQELE